MRESIACLLQYSALICSTQGSQHETTSTPSKNSGGKPSSSVQSNGSPHLKQVTSIRVSLMKARMLAAWVRVVGK